jgi:YVTN family beta-propeller protein
MRLFPKAFAKPCLALLAAAAIATAASAAPPPQFQADANWLKPPPGLVLGEISAVAVDSQDRVWVLQRPRSLAKDDAPHAAPPVLLFDRQGNYLRGFGGPGPGYEWPATEHSLAVDGRGRVWVAGNSRTEPAGADDMLLQFDGDGRFLRQIGHRGASKGDLDTQNLYAPGDIFVDDAARDVYVADGYGNRRIIVFDSETGAFKRMWSAFGAPPPAEPAPAPRAVGAPFTPESGEGPQGFNGVHGVKVSRDGLVYVSDRNNQRIQVFTKDGRFVKQGFVARNTPSPQTASGLAFSPDAKQRYLYVADWGNNSLLVLDRATLATLRTIGVKGIAPGAFLGPHLIATDSKGVLYVAEVQGRRLQRLTPVKP